MAVTKAGAKSLAYAQITANQTGITPTTTDITGLSVTFTATSRPIWVELYIPAITLNTAAGICIAFVTDSSNNQIAEWIQSLSAGEWGRVKAVRRLTSLTPGTSYTFKARTGAPAGATVDVRASTDAIPTTFGGPAHLRVYEEA